MKTVYVLKLENYQGETTFELFHHKDNAARRYNELLKENCRKSEFECDNEDDYVKTFSYFDPDYNEYSTYITLTESDLNELFED